jgi:hypothetical protein
VLRFSQRGMPKQKPARQGRARWCQGQSPRGSIPVPVLGMFCECLWASTTATGRQPRSRSCPIRIACSRASVLRVVSSSPRDHPRGRVCCLPSSVSNISQLIEIASRVVQPLFDGSHCGFFCCLASLGSFLAIIPCRQGGRVLGFIHEPQHSRGPADRELSRPLGQRNRCEGRLLDADRGSGLTDI